jgi:Fe-S-cluster containining protein
MAWFKSGLQFGCTRCSACCRHNPGYVFLSQPDIDALCSFTQLDEKEFRKRYTRLTDFGFVRRLSLTEKSNFDCIFWDQGCTVYNARPLQCRAFPFWSSILSDQGNWDEQANDCPGINQGPVHSAATIQAWLNARSAEPFVED